MPWKSFLIEDEYCVFLLDDDDNRTGSSLGCHETQEEANDQVAALNISEDETRTLFGKFWESFKALVSRERKLPERAIAGSIVFDSLWQRMLELDAEIEGSDHYLVDMYFDDNGFYALYVDRGKLFRYDLAIQDNDVVLGERIEVMELHQPVETRTVIRQQEDGRYRWFSISGTAVLNRSGEIDSRALFDSFVEYAEETGKYPIRMFYHQGGITENWEMDDTTRAFKTGQADFLARDGYCYITSGLYDDIPLAKVEIAALRNNPDFWGESIRFWPTKAELTEISDGINIPVYKEGFNVEISTLPEMEAAHLMTRTEVRMSLDGKARDAWLKLWIDSGQTEEDALKWLADHPEARNRAIEQAGMIKRKEELAELVTLFNEDKDKAIERLGELADELSEEDDTTEDETPTEIFVDESVIEAVAESEPFTQLSDRLTQLETQLSEQPEVAQASEIEELRSVVDKLTKRLVTLEKGEQAVQQQVIDDKPAKFNGKPTITYRPREANAALQEDGTPYSEKAKANLPKGANY